MQRWLGLGIFTQISITKRPILSTIVHSWSHPAFGFGDVVSLVATIATATRSETTQQQQTTLAVHSYEFEQAVFAATYDFSNLMHAGHFQLQLYCYYCCSCSCASATCEFDGLSGKVNVIKSMLVFTIIGGLGLHIYLRPHFAGTTTAKFPSTERVHLPPTEQQSAN